MNCNGTLVAVILVHSGPVLKAFVWMCCE